MRGGAPGAPLTLTPAALLSPAPDASPAVGTSPAHWPSPRPRWGARAGHHAGQAHLHPDPMPHAERYADSTGFPEAVKPAGRLRSSRGTWCLREDKMAVPRECGVEPPRAAGAWRGL